MNRKSLMALGAMAIVAVAFLAGKPASADDTAKKEDPKTSGTGSKLDADLKPYEKVSGVSGKISSVGSDTLNNLMTLWQEGFKKHYPNVTIEIEGKGSSTAPPALINGTADVGPMSRKMKSSEIKDFEAKFKYPPTEIAVAIDALAVFVHKDNPVEKLTMPHVDAIFSANRKGGYKEDISKWGQVGLKGDWENEGITMYGRNNASGTYGYFKEHALFNGDYKAAVKEQSGSSTVVQKVEQERGAIGYSGIGYASAGVRAVPLAKDASSEQFEATAENCYSGKYPLSRFLFIYVNKPQGKELNLVVKEFLKFVLSKDGQEITLKDGYIPLRQKEAGKYVKAIQ